MALFFYSSFMMIAPPVVIPAKAGIQTLCFYGSPPARGQVWIPAFAGMTERSL